MKDSLHTLIYSAVLGLVCATLLTTAATITEPYQKKNAEAEKKRNILAVLAVPFDEKASPQELVELFEKNVRKVNIGELEAFTYTPDSGGKVTAVPFAGPGLWGPIKGFLALEEDMRTIVGVTFHEQEETPGLGGEITSDWFRGQFKGRRIVDDDGKPGIIIRIGSAARVNEVDGITGATMTCDKVQDMLNEVIEKIVKEQNGHG